MSDLPENDDHELEGQHPPLAPTSAARAASAAPGAQPGAGLAEHGLRGRAGEPETAAGATRAPDDATRHFDTAQGRLSYTELAEGLAEPLQKLDLRIRASEFVQRALNEALLLDFHRELSTELFPDDAGRFRTSAVCVGAHQPPDATRVPGLIRDYTANLAEQLRHVATAEERIIELLAYAEGELLTIHPFRDLNGRVSRLWLLELLTRLGLPAVDIAPSAGTFRSRYLAALAAWDRRDRLPLQALWRERLGQPVALNDIVLPGCTPTPLASYLKALAVLRLVAEDAEHGDPEAMGWWRDDQFVLRTKLNRKELYEFFLEHWKPTPLVAPWNGGSGFYFQERKLKEKDPVTGKKVKTGVRDQPTEATRTVAAIAAGNADRLFAYRAAIQSAKAVIEEFGLSEAPENGPSSKVKDRFILRLRNAASDSAQRAMDCVVLLVTDGVNFPPMMGTGGNDGNLDFTNNFMQRLTELFAPSDGTPSARASTWLDAALFASSAQALVGSSVGQFAPGMAGSPNGAAGFESTAGVNPFDFALMVEGAVLFAGSAVRRLEAVTGSTLSAPFAVFERLGVSGATSADDDGDSRRELWMPLWGNPMSLQELASLLAEGRAAVHGRSARDGLDFARAIALLGVDRGINEFQRYAILKRQGKNHLATPLNRIAVRRNADADLIADLERRDWLSNVQRYARDDNASNAFRSAARQLDTALFAMTQNASRQTMQSVLRQLGRIEAALSASAKARESVRQPAPRLSAAWAIKANDGSAEFGIAAALSGLRVVDERRWIKLEARRHLAVVGDPLNVEGDRAWTPESRLMVWSAGPIEANLAALLHRRRLEMQALGQEGEVLASRNGATCADVEAFLRGDTEDRRIAELFGGLACVDLEDFPPPHSVEEVALAPAFILLKILFTPESLLHRVGWLPQDKHLHLPAEIPARLTADQPDAAVRIAWARLRALGVKLPGRDPPRVIGADGPRWLAALCIPLTFTETTRLLKRLDLDPEDLRAEELPAATSA